MSVWNILFLTSLINSCGAAYFLQGYPGDPGELGKKAWRLKIPLKWNFYFIFTGVRNVVHIDIDCHLDPNVVSHGCPPWMSTLLPQTSDRSSANLQSCQSCTLKFAGCSAYSWLQRELGTPMTGTADWHRPCLPAAVDWSVCHTTLKAWSPALCAPSNRIEESSGRTNTSYYTYHYYTLVHDGTTLLCTLYQIV